MSCCTPIAIAFQEQSVVTIPYTAQMMIDFGSIPTITVYHKDGSDHILMRGLDIRIIGYPTNTIRIDNGGKATGYVKISK